MIEPFAPRRTGKDPERLTLVGKLIPYKDGEPCWLSMSLSPHTYLPCFDDESQMSAVLSRAGITFDAVKQITDGLEFRLSIPTSIIIIANLRWTEAGTLRFMRVLRD